MSPCHLSFLNAQALRSHSLSKLLPSRFYQLHNLKGFANVPTLQGLLLDTHPYRKTLCTVLSEIMIFYILAYQKILPKVRDRHHLVFISHSKASIQLRVHSYAAASKIYTAFI